MGTDAEVAEHQPRVVHVDAQNGILRLGNDPAEPVPGAQDQLNPRFADSPHVSDHS